MRPAPPLDRNAYRWAKGALTAILAVMGVLALAQIGLLIHAIARSWSAG